MPDQQDDNSSRIDAARLAAVLANVADRSLAEALRSVDAMDAKAGVLLGFDGVFAGLLFGHGIGVRWLFVIGGGLAFAVVFACLALWPRAYGSWPKARELYKTCFNKEEAEIQTQLLEEFAASLDDSRGAMAQKAACLCGAVVGLAVSILAAIAWLVFVPAAQ